MSKKVLLAWDQQGEGLDYYLIENPTEEELAVLKSACGNYVNSDDNEDVCKVSLALTPGEYFEAAKEGALENEKKWVGILNKCKRYQVDEIIDLDGISLLITAGICP